MTLLVIAQIVLAGIALGKRGSVRGKMNYRANVFNDYGICVVRAPFIRLSRH